MKKILVLSLISLIFPGCKKNQLGGDASIAGTVRHHSKAIGGARIFIKFNATEFPGKDTTKYDAKVVADAEGKYKISCYKGHYFLYGFGYDAGVPGNVSGGVAVKARSKENVATDVPVTED